MGNTLYKQFPVDTAEKAQNGNFDKCLARGRDEGLKISLNEITPAAREYLTKEDPADRLGDRERVLRRQIASERRKKKPLYALDALGPREAWRCQFHLGASSLD